MKRLFFSCFLSLNLLCGLLASYQSKAQIVNPVFSILDTVARNNPASAAAFLDLGQYYFFNQKFSDANQQFAKAIELDAEDADFYFFQAAAYEAQGQMEKALDNYDKAIGLQNATEYLLRRVQIRYKLKKYAAAAADCREILQTYETMADIKKILADCEKNGGAADKPAEPNATTMKITPEAGAIFLDKFIKNFERFSDTGDLYRGLLYFFTDNIDKAFPMFEKVIQKNNDAEAMYYHAIVQEVKKNPEAAMKLYQQALFEIEEELTETKFEKFAGYKDAVEEIKRLENIKTDYLFRNHAVATSIGKTPELPVAPESDELVRGEMKAAKDTYLFDAEKLENSDGQKNNYKLEIKTKMGNKIMVAKLVAEKQGNLITVKITHAGKKDASSLVWNNYPQDFMTARYMPSNNAKYKYEGSRLTVEKNAKVNLEELGKIHPMTLNFTQAVAHAARAYMVLFIVK
jgi:tetratricopeptide (TPR) repeat protein